ncbi:MAG: HAD family phosphatase [Actinobacteria bacterium]|nr:HAD family phosphatase [Actinomycetota bacterium]
MTAPDQRGLLVDFGGVLTTSPYEAFAAFERAEGLPAGIVMRILRDAFRSGDTTNVFARYERGEASDVEFADGLIEAVRAQGYDLPPGPLHRRIFASSLSVDDMWGVVRRAREAGVRTALLSNSWGVDGYPLPKLREHFDELVISGEVGLRKPEPEIYLLAADRLDVAPEHCAFVDDMRINIDGARSVGMFGVLHRDVADTATQLAAFLGVVLA